MFDPGILMLTQGSRKAEADPGYVFQAIRENVYKHKSITPVLIMLVAYFLAARHGIYLTLEDVSGIIFQLKKSLPKLKIQEVAMRVVPHGYHSEDIEIFFCGLLTCGYAYYEDTHFKLNAEGVILSRKLICDFFGDEPLVFTELSRLIWQIIYPKFFKDPIF